MKKIYITLGNNDGGEYILEVTVTRYFAQPVSWSTNSLAGSGNSQFI